MPPKKRRGDSDSDEEDAKVSKSAAPQGKKSAKKGGNDGDDVDALSKSTQRLKLGDGDEDDGRGGKGGKKGKKNRGDDSDADDAPKAVVKVAAKSGKKGGKGDDGSADEATPKKGGNSGKKGRAASDDDDADDKRAPASKSAASGKKGKGKGKRDDGSDDDMESSKPANAQDDDEEDRTIVPKGKAGPGTTSAPQLAGGAKKKGGKKGKKGRGDDSDDDDDDGGPSMLSMPTLGKSSLLKGGDSDEDERRKPLTKKEKKAKGGQAKGGKGRPQDEEEDDEEEKQAVEEEEPINAPAPVPAPVMPAEVVGFSPEGGAGKKKSKKTAAEVEQEEAEPEPEQPIATPPLAPEPTPAPEPVAVVEPEIPSPPPMAAGPAAEGDGDDNLFAKKKKKKKVTVAEAEEEPAAAVPRALVAERREEKADKKEKKEKKERKEEEGEPGMFFGEASMGVSRAAGGPADSDGYTGVDDNGTAIGLDGEEVAPEMGKALAKRVRGGDLSNRERRLVTAYDEERAARGPRVAGGALHDEGDEMGLASFSLSQAGKMATSGPGEGSAALENTKDILVENFTISAYKKILFENASLRIAHGRRYGLVGPNGQGKSTLLKHMAAREMAIPGRIDMLYVEQEVVADDTPAIQAVLRADKKRYSLLTEEKRILDELDAADAAEAKGVKAGWLSDAERSVREERLNAVYEELAVSKADAAEASARKILSGLGFTVDMQEKPTKHFSGGWRMRISLARALFMQPDLLLLDEPTNHLDLNAVIWLEDYLSRWKTTLLVVSHDQDFLSSVVTDIIHLEEKKLFYYKGNYDDFKGMHAQKMEKQQKDWERQQKALKSSKEKGKSSKEAEAQAKARAKREAGKNDTKATKAAKQSNVGEAEQEAAGTASDLIIRPREYVVQFDFDDPPILPPPVLSVSNAAFQYGPKYPVLFEKLNFGIDQGSRVAIVGPNGVGKSTLLNMLIGEKGYDPTEGDVQRNRFLRVGKYSQHFVDILSMDKSPVEFLQSKFTDLTYQDARSLLGRFGLEGHAHTILNRDLSGGQKARVVFAELSLSAPHIMVLDEPTNNLDIESIDALTEALAAYGGGVVLVSHDARLIRGAGCLLWVCDKKTVTPFDGNIDDYRLSLIESIHADEEQLEEVMARRAAEEEEKRLAAARERNKKFKELREAAKAGKGGSATA